MNRLGILIIAVCAALPVTTSCCGPSTDYSENAPDPAGAKAAPIKALIGDVTETMNAAEYTYVHVVAGDQSIWAAAPTFDVKVGDQVLVPVGMPMVNFYSNTLDRTFDVIYFCGIIEKPGRVGPVKTNNSGVSNLESGLPADPPLPTSRPDGPLPQGHPAVTSKPGEPVETSDIAKAEGGLTVEEVFQQSSTLAGQQVVIHGRVVKYNQGILGRNWLHIQDGSGSQGTDDLTVTSTGTAKVGDTVLIRGVLATDKDFGAGYRYDVIVENAEITVELPGP